MGKFKKVLIMAMAFILLLAIDNRLSAVFAAVPRLINYQGRITDSSGNPLTGSYSITFRIYDAETAGNLLWEETQAGVVIDKGLLGILLGSVTALNIPFDKPYFLEIKVGTEVMSPRQRITSAGYAIRAEVAESVSNIDPGMVGTKTVDETGMADGMVTYYDSASGKVKYKGIPAQVSQVKDADAGTAYGWNETTFLSVNKTITSGKTVLLIASGYLVRKFNQDANDVIRLKHGTTIVQTVSPASGVTGNHSWSTCAIVTGLSGATTFSLTAEHRGDGVGTAYGNLTVLEF